jgi:hypothetical protein
MSLFNIDFPVVGPSHLCLNPRVNTTEPRTFSLLTANAATFSIGEVVLPFIPSDSVTLVATTVAGVTVQLRDFKGNLLSTVLPATTSGILGSVISGTKYTLVLNNSVSAVVNAVLATIGATATPRLTDFFAQGLQIVNPLPNGITVAYDSDALPTFTFTNYPIIENSNITLGQAVEALQAGTFVFTSSSPSQIISFTQNFSALGGYLLTALTNSSGPFSGTYSIEIAGVGNSSPVSLVPLGNITPWSQGNTIQMVGATVNPTSMYKLPKLPSLCIMDSSEADHLEPPIKRLNSSIYA